MTTIGGSGPHNGYAGGWFDGWDVDSQGNRLRFNPRVTQIGGKEYVPLSPADPRFSDQGTPQSYLKSPVYKDVLKKYPDAFVQGPDGQWYLSTDAQNYMSDVSGVIKANTTGFWNGGPGPVFLAAGGFMAPVAAAGGLGAGGLAGADAAAAASGGVGAFDTFGSLGTGATVGPAGYIPVDAAAYTGATGGAAFPGFDASWGVNPQQFTGNLNDIINPQSQFAQNLTPNFPGAQTAISGAPGASAVGMGGANIANYSALNTFLNQFGLPTIPNVGNGTSGSGNGGTIPGTPSGTGTSSFWGPVATIGSSIVGGLLQNNAIRNAARDASGAQLAASTEGVAELRRQFDAVQALLRPYANAGVGSLTAQQDLLGLRGPQAQQAAISGLETSPAFTSMTKQGESALLQNASATGGLRGGNLEGALAKFRPQLLAQLIDRQYSNLGGITMSGQNAAAGVGNAGMNTGGAIAGLIGQQGAAQAGNSIAQAAARARQYGEITGGIGAFAGMGGFDKLPNLNLF